MDLVFYIIAQEQKIKGNILDVAENMINNIIKHDTLKKQIFVGYYESHEFIHPSLYGYIGYYSMNFDYIDEFIHYIYETMFSFVLSLLEPIEEIKEETKFIE